MEAKLRQYKVLYVSQSERKSNAKVPQEHHKNTTGTRVRRRTARTMYFRRFAFSDTLIWYVIIPRGVAGRGVTRDPAGYAVVSCTVCVPLPCWRDHGG